VTGEMQDVKLLPTVKQEFKPTTLPRFKVEKLNMEYLKQEKRKSSDSNEDESTSKKKPDYGVQSTNSTHANSENGQMRVKVEHGFAKNPIPPPVYPPPSPEVEILELEPGPPPEVIDLEYDEPMPSTSTTAAHSTTTPSHKLSELRSIYMTKFPGHRLPGSAAIHWACHDILLKHHPTGTPFGSKELKLLMLNYLLHLIKNQGVLDDALKYPFSARTWPHTESGLKGHLMQIIKVATKQGIKPEHNIIHILDFDLAGAISAGCDYIESDDLWKNSSHPVNLPMPYPLFILTVQAALPDTDITSFLELYIEHMNKVAESNEEFLLGVMSAVGGELERFPTYVVDIFTERGMLRPTVFPGGWTSTTRTYDGTQHSLNLRNTYLMSQLTVDTEEGDMGRL